MEGTGSRRAARSREEPGDAGVYEAMLLTAGERGYDAASLAEVAERAGIDCDRLRRRHGDKEECFARAYEDAAERLGGELLEACREAASWREGFRAGLARLLRFVAERPFLAKALLVEVKAARGRAWAKHQQVVERLTAALDTARREPGARPSATAMTAGFMVGAIEESLCIELAGGRGDRVEWLLPDLMHLALLQFFGEEATGSRGGPAGQAAADSP